MRSTIACFGVAFLLLVISVFSLERQQPTPAETGTAAIGPEMILIPGGSYIMGKERKPEEKQAEYIDNPAHKVQISAFYLDKTEVTNSEYFRFCRATGHRLPFFWSLREYRSGLDYPNHPVVGISYQDAQDYAKWRGVRLPTEAEWEFAARGGLSGKDFPKGDTLETTDANFAPQGHGPEPVGRYKANGYGLCDMAGNVGEWVSDYYDKDYYLKCPEKNPSGPEIGRFRVFRGGGWFANISCNRVHFRNALPANWVDFNIGFRCAKNK
jgi:iron(II)-dependent oxidoreductase